MMSLAEIRQFYPANLHSKSAFLLREYLQCKILELLFESPYASKFAFLGGTCLRIVHNNQRFSEDLDFTFLDDSIAREQIFSWFGEIFEYIKDEANIPLEITDNNEHQDGGINFYISYTGPLGGMGSNKKVKVDISKSERLEFDPVIKPSFINYSDIDDYELLCYSLEEILVEKMRSVMQRMQARDFYDIWYLLEQEKMEVEFYIDEFSQKCAAKNLNPADFLKKLTERLPGYKGRWKGSLAEQIQHLPDFERVEREVMRHLRKVDFS